MASSSISDTRNPPDNSAYANRILVEYEDFIRAILSFYVGNEVEREDLFQDFFLGLISKPIPEDVQNIRGYIYRMLCDNIKDAFRRIGRYQNRLRRYAERRKYSVEGRPEDNVIDAEEVEKMFELISSRLPENEATAMALRYRHNCSIRETAEKMNIKPRSVSRYLSAGTRKLRQVLGVGERSSQW